MIKNRAFRGPSSRIVGLALVLALQLASNARAQTVDTIYLSNGDRASGRIVSVETEKLVLETPYAGSITIRTEALARVVVDGREFASSALDQLQAALAARAAAQLPAEPKAEPKAETADNPPSAAVSQPRFLKQFSGTAGLGFSLQQTTSSTRGLTSDLNLYRASLDKVGQAARTETGLILSQSYSHFSSKSAPSQGTDSFSADLSHAMRIRGKWSVFGLAAFDHASAEGLNLLQLYASGLSYTAWNHDGNRLELSAGIDYSARTFVVPKLNIKLIGALLEEQYTRTFASGLSVKEQYRIDRAITHPEDVDAKGSVSVDAPITKILAFRISFNHRYMNVIPRGDKRNSFEASGGLDLTIGNAKTSSLKGARRKKKKKK